MSSAERYAVRIKKNRQWGVGSQLLSMSAPGVSLHVDRARRVDKSRRGLNDISVLS
jgi:hypothetical protein